MVCSSGPCDGQLFVHNYDVTWTGYEFSGTGQSTVMGDTYTEAICGAVSGDQVVFHSVYTTADAGTVIDGTATLATDKTAEGMADSVDTAGETQNLAITITTLKIACE